MKRLILVLAYGFFAACSPTSVDRATINAWMLCDECDSGERAAVQALGDDAVGALALRLRGPPITRYEAMRRKFAESYQSGLGMTEEAYIALMLEGYVALYQTRSAESLGDIATPRARVTLALARDEAAVRGYRSDVLRAIESALVRSSLQAFDGTLSDSVINFGDTIVVRPSTGLSWDGNEDVVLHGSPFALHVRTIKWDRPEFDDSLAFVAAGEVGEYQLSVINAGSSQVKQADRVIRIESLRNNLHSSSTPEVVTGTRLPQTRYIALSPPRDTADYYWFEPAEAKTVNVVARWPGLDPLRFHWGPGGHCSLAFLSGTDVAGQVVDENEQPLAGAVVNIVGTGISLVTSATGEFPITSVPAVARPDGIATLRLRRIGYRPQEYRVPVSAGGFRLSMTPAKSTRATARNLLGITTTIPAGECRVLAVIAEAGGQPRIVRLRIH